MLLSKDKVLSHCKLLSVILEKRRINSLLRLDLFFNFLKYPRFSIWDFSFLAIIF